MIPAFRRGRFQSGAPRRTVGIQTRTGTISPTVIYGSVNPPVYSRIPRAARTLLDVGCGDGTLGRKLHSEWGVQVTGITHSTAEAELARTRLVKVVVADLNDFDPVGLGQFDCIVCSHVLEHLHAPGELLRRMQGNFSSGGCLIVALPNLLHWRQRLALLRGRFRYTEGGLMDRTHLRFFDWETAAGLLRDTGYEL